MLELSRRLNPECEHVLGDMRTPRLGSAFDAVLIHDAVMYMTGSADLRAALDTAAAHLRPGGVAIALPDVVRGLSGTCSTCRSRSTLTCWGPRWNGS